MNTATQMVADWFYSTDEHANMARSIVAKHGMHVQPLRFALESAVTANLSQGLTPITARLVKLTLDAVDWYAVARDVRDNA